MITLLVWCDDNDPNEEMFWCGRGCGPDATGWSFDRSDAKEYATTSAASDQCRRLKSDRPFSRFALRNDAVLA